MVGLVSGTSQTNILLFNGRLEISIPRASCKATVVGFSLLRSHADLTNKATRGSVGKAIEGIKPGTSAIDRFENWSREPGSFVSPKNSMIFGKTEIVRSGNKTKEIFTAGALLCMFQKYQISGAPFDGTIRGLRPHVTIIDAFIEKYDDPLYVSYIVNDVVQQTNKPILPKFSPLTAVDLACAEARLRSIQYLLAVVRASNTTALQVWEKAGFKKLPGSQGFSVAQDNEVFNGYFLDVTDVTRKQSGATPSEFKLATSICTYTAIEVRTADTVDDV